MSAEKFQSHKDEIARRAQRLYDEVIRFQVETPENIGKMVIIDIESGDYGVDPTGIVAAQHLYAQHANASLFGIRIGYRVADAIGCVMERTAK